MTAFWQFGGMVFTSVLGTALHFLFDLTGGAAVAPFTAVNESIWEHTKLLFLPMTLWAIAEWFRFGKETAAFWCVKLRGVLLGIVLIPTLYYTYTGVLGVSSDYVNILIFFVTAAVVYRFETRRLRNRANPLCRKPLVFAVWIGVAILYAVWTFFPPLFPLFCDPLTGTYGYR